MADGTPAKAIHMDAKGIGIIVLVVFGFVYLWENGSLSFLPGAPKPKKTATDSSGS